MDLVTPAAALAWADRYWGIHGDISMLPSYLDQNFRIRGDAGDHVLKVAHPSWSRLDLDLENHAMMMLAEREPRLQWPHVQVALTGEHLLALPIDGQDCHVRMLRFVPGATYAEVVGALSPAQRTRLHESLGGALGRLTRGLSNFQHPHARRAHVWSLLRLPELQDEVEHIDDARLRDTVRVQMRAFCAQLPHWLNQLPMSVVHNDANDYNIIVQDDGDGNWSVHSLIDFGDTCTSFRLADLAIACTYAMQHEVDPVACAHSMVRGYLAQCSLHRVELEQLRALIIARLCQSILMATRAHREQPDNSYVLVSQQGVRALLYVLSDVAPGALVAPFLESCDE